MSDIWAEWDAGRAPLGAVPYEQAMQRSLQVLPRVLDGDMDLAVMELHRENPGGARPGAPARA